MELLNTCNTCEAIIKRRRSSIIEKMANNLDNEREFGLAIGKLKTLNNHLQRVWTIRKLYGDLIKEVEQIAEQADQI